MNKHYTKEIKLEVVTKKLSGESTTKLVREYGLSGKSRVNVWVKQYKNGNTTFEETRGKATSKTSPSKGRKKIIKREDMSDKEYIEYLEMEVDILKKISEVKALNGLNKYYKYEIIKLLAIKYPVTALCSYLGASTSTYYLYLKRNPEKYDDIIIKLIKEIHSKRISSGYRSIKMILHRKYNLIVNHKKVFRIMKFLNICGKQNRRKYKFDKALIKSRTFDNILNRDFKCSKSNQKWSIDITYVPDKIKNTYLVCIKDLFDKRIVNFKNSDTMDEEFVQNCVREAFATHKVKDTKLILHSDQGIHFSTNAYIKLLKDFNVIGSHSRKGNCHDNAPIESFFSIFKREAFNFTRPVNYSHTVDLTKEFIEYYNNDRCQYSLNKKTPCEFYSA